MKGDQDKAGTPLYSITTSGKVPSTPEPGRGDYKAFYIQESMVYSSQVESALHPQCNQMITYSYDTRWLGPPRIGQEGVPEYMKGSLCFPRSILNQLTSRDQD